jgi:hypothetical protein
MARTHKHRKGDPLNNDPYFRFVTDPQVRLSIAAQRICMGKEPDTRKGKRAARRRIAKGAIKGAIAGFSIAKLLRL